MKRLAVSLFFIAVCSHAFCDEGQKNIKSVTPAVTAQCPAPADVESHHLHGLWQVKLYDGPLHEDSRQPIHRQPQRLGTLLLESHAEHRGSLRGTFKLQGETTTHWLSGDVDEGELIFDESEDGEKISAIWVAYPTATGCGSEWRGNRRLAESDALQTLVLIKVPSWQ
jgi:hypothetical protein